MFTSPLSRVKFHEEPAPHPTWEEALNLKILAIRKVTMQEPADDDTDGKQEEDEQRSGHLDRPEQEPDLHSGDILNYEEDRQAGKDQNKDQFNVHVIPLLRSMNGIYG